MRKIASAAAALGMSVAMMAGVTAPAHANNLAANCNTHSRGVFTDGHVCVEVWWRDQADGSGIVVEDIRIKAMPLGAFESNGFKVDGYKLRLFNNGGQVVWEKGDGECNIGQSGEHFFPMPNGELKLKTNIATVLYDYKARLDNANDVEDSVGKTFG